jgi:hypothetical protein
MGRSLSRVARAPWRTAKSPPSYVYLQKRKASAGPLHERIDCYDGYLYPSGIGIDGRGVRFLGTYRGRDDLAESIEAVPPHRFGHDPGYRGGRFESGYAPRGAHCKRHDTTQKPVIRPNIDTHIPVAAGIQNQTADLRFDSMVPRLCKHVMRGREIEPAPFEFNLITNDLRTPVGGENRIFPLPQWRYRLYPGLCPQAARQRVGGVLYTGFAYVLHQNLDLSVFGSHRNCLSGQETEIEIREGVGLLR